MSLETVRLGDIAEINPRRPMLEFSDTDGVTFVPMESVDDVTGALVRPVERMFSQVKKGYTVFSEGDVIFAKITPCMQNGKHAVVRNLIGGVGFGSTEFHVIRACEDVEPEWIHYFLRRKETLDAAIRSFTGTVGQQRVPSSFLEELELPLPSLKEQRRIVPLLKAQLAAVEGARQAAQLQLDEIRLLKTQALSAVFGCITETSPVGDVAKVQSGFAFKSQEFRKQGIRLLRNANIYPGHVYWVDAVYLSPDDSAKYSSYALNEGDVLISLDRPIISSGIKVARVGSVDLPALLVQRVGRFQINKKRLDAQYFYAYLHTQAFINAISGHDQSLGVPHISPAQVEAVQIPLPNLDVQKRLARTVSEIIQTFDVAIASAEHRLSDISWLPSRLLAEAFESITHG